MAGFETVQKRVQELRGLLDYHSKRYYEDDAPEIEDYEYDQLLRELEELEEAHPELVTPDSPTRRIGGRADSQFTPVTHTVVMESLQDGFSEDEVRDFDRRVRSIRSMWWSPKLTGYPFRWNMKTACLCVAPRGAMGKSARISRSTCARSAQSRCASKNRCRIWRCAARYICRGNLF